MMWPRDHSPHRTNPNTPPTPWKPPQIPHPPTFMNNAGQPRPTRAPGPMAAVDEFLSETREFAVDGSREKFHLTFNPRGYLRKQG